ncbi:MAG: hypothetical protein ACW99U_07010 [Candidatus Thorarchaeota archaeon]|jgi:hypothetical protein
MKQSFREFFMEKLLVLMRPEDIDMSAKEFLSMYASYMDGAGIVGKDPSGHALFQSRTAPVEENHTKFFVEWVDLTEALGIHTAASMDFYTDVWFAKDPKYQTVTSEGQTMNHQICPNREEFWQYGAEVVKELGIYPIHEILLFGTGFIRDKFCFCERCRTEFSPLVDQEPNRLTYDYIIENPDHHAKWHEWRSQKVHDGLRVLQNAATESDETVGREKPLSIAVEMLLDPETGLSEGAKNEYGYDYGKILDITKNVMINLYPWSPILPGPGQSDYDALVEALYFTTEFKRRGGTVSLFRWGLSSIDSVREMKQIGKDAGIERFMGTFGYPTDYSVRRESAVGNY